MSSADSSERELEELKREVERTRRRLEKQRLRNELAQMKIELIELAANSEISPRHTVVRAVVAPSSTRGVEATTTEGNRTRTRKHKEAKETKKTKVASKTDKESDAKELSHEHSFNEEFEAREFAKAYKSVFPYRRWGR